jgi:uncharacterized pyridoxamine 5'-phosphate oxidase family protein
MQEVLNFLRDAKVFYFSTVDQGKPRTRPYGFVMDFEDKLYFATLKSFGSYQQLISNPSFAISVMADKKWIEIKGEAVFDERQAVKEKSFEVAPQIKGMFKSPDNPDYILFYLTNGEATFYSFSTAPRTIKL